MIPAEILKALGIAVSELAGAAADAVVLRAAYDKAKSVGDPRGIFSRFVGAWRKGDPTRPLKDIQQLYSVAKAWKQVPSLLERFPEDLALDERLARTFASSNRFEKAYSPYNLFVGVKITDKATGEVTYQTYVYKSTDMPVVADAFQEAKFDMIDRMMFYPPTKGKEDINEYHIEYSVLDYVKLV